MLKIKICQKYQKYTREILDSRNPTVEVDVELESGAMGRAAVPAGFNRKQGSLGKLRDNDENRFLGKAFLKAV